MLYVTNVEVLRATIGPKLEIVRVIGLTGSQGWSAPQLVATFAGKPLDDILDLQFIATMPSQSQKAEGFVPLGAVFALDEGHPFKGVRVRASENAVEVKQIPGSSQANITVSGCKDRIGKKFAERGEAQPGQPGVVRQEDLPKVLRWIIPSRGIRGITHNPNRLNLILGDAAWRQFVSRRLTPTASRASPLRSVTPAHAEPPAFPFCRYTLAGSGP